MPKVVLFVTDVAGSGGAETVFVNLIAELDRSEFTPIVLLPGPGWLADQLRRLDIQPIFQPMSGSFNRPLIKKLTQLIKQHQVAIINAHLFGSSIYCAIAAALTRTPLISTFHGIIDIAPDERLLAIKAWLVRRFSTKLVFVSNYLKQQLNSRLHAPESKCEIIYNGLAIERFDEALASNLRQQFNIPAEHKLVAMIGNANHSKGYDLVVQAASQVPDDITFLIAGEYSEEQLQTYRQSAEPNIVGTKVKFIGFVDNVASFLKAADMYLLSSRDEGFSLSTIEAMAAKVPVVCTRCGGPEEIIEPGVTGILIENENSKAIAQAITQVLNTEAQQTMIEQAWQYVKSNFSIETSAGRYFDLFHSLAKKEFNHKGNSRV
ncbi:MAG: glycosyltransferase family 4 protein [Gammaproteobacteria bacterium]|nr:glycosyltransferase family 4 protein [Gammaproteobacteria bacterium]